MLKLSFALLVIGLFTAVEGGCGGGSADASTGDTFITGDVGGVTIRAAMTSACGTVGVADGQIWATVAVATPGEGWTLHMNNSVGTTDCPVAFVQLADNFGDAPARLRSDVSDASCSVTVTAAAPAIGDVVEGTFSATMPTTPTGPMLVTNGAFRVMRDRQ